MNTDRDEVLWLLLRLLLILFFVAFALAVIYYGFRLPD